jgi:hypothetical protein
MADPPHHPGSDTSGTARYQRGLQAYASQFHLPPDQVPAWFAGTAGDRSGEEVIQSAANAWTDDELSLRDRSLIVIAALIAQGDLEAQLRMHTRWAGPRPPHPPNSTRSRHCSRSTPASRGPHVAS